MELPSTRHEDIRRKLAALDVFCRAAASPEATIRFEAEALATAAEVAREVAILIDDRRLLVQETAERRRRARSDAFEKVRASANRARRVKAALAKDQPIPVAGEPDDGEPFPLPWQLAEVEE